jgi:formylglycine-generating enzyme required for sulfatase activity/tetratricopeptide (TPR) repeat protein
MPSESVVTELLLRWEEQPSLAPEDLCRAYAGQADYAALLEAVRRGIRELQGVAGFLAAQPEASDPSPIGAGASNTVVDPQRTEEAPGRVPAAPAVPGYEVLGELGRGGMGVVYRARHLALNRVVALKMVLAGAHTGAEGLARFRSEARAVARLQHPHIVQIHEVGESGGLPFFALEFCAGGSLDKTIQGSPRLPQEAARLVEALARAMHAAHERQVIHRDLKPANVLLVEDCTPKITDFGLAKLLDERQKTQTGALLGTPSYMAPEQTTGSNPEVGPATDVYALGAILYELLTGRPPFRAASDYETLLLVVQGEPVPPRRLYPKVARDLEAICLKCLEKKPAKRYASALALAEDLRRFQAGERIMARPAGRMEQVVKWAKRKPAAAGLCGVLLTAVLAAGAVWAWLVEQAAERRAEAVIRAERTQGAVEALLTAAPGSVPFILETLKPRKADVLPNLAKRLAHPERTFEQRLRLNVALAALGEDRAADLCALAVETPPAESFNLVLGLKCGDRQRTVERLGSLYREAKADTGRCRLSITLLELGDPRPAQAELALKPNPSARVHFIHLFPTWHGDLAAVLELLRSVNDPAFRSGLCLALGSIDPAHLPSETRRALDAVLTDLYTSDLDGGTHSAAGWALKRRGSPLPALPRTQAPVGGRRWFVNRQGMTLVGIEPGLFHPNDYELPASWDGPLQTVVLTRPFFMVDQEVTAEWYRRFLSSDDHPEGEKLTEIARRADLSHEVARVYWPGAILFCNWLSRAEGRTPCYRPDASGRLGVTCDCRANGYRLPTDAECEYVFRCGTATKFVTGDDVDRMLDYGRVFAAEIGPGKTYYPNPWGLFDLLGNGWETCWDGGYGQNVPGLTTNPVGNGGGVHTIRGGSYDAGPVHLHGSYRAPLGPEQEAWPIRPVCGPLEAGADPDQKAALVILTRWLERFPEWRPQVWKERGRLYAELGQHEKAAADYCRCLEQGPDSAWLADSLVRQEEVFARVAKARPGDLRLWWVRAEWAGSRGRWREAAAASRRLVDLSPANISAWFYDALVRLHTDDRKGYREDCREMLRRFGATKRHDWADLTAKTCLLLPDAVRDLKPVLQLARRSLAGAENHVSYRWFLVCRALAELRAGQLDVTIQFINQVAPDQKGGPLDATAYVILALAEQRRGRSAAARQALARAQVIRALGWFRIVRGQQYGGDWGDWLRCEILRGEAESVIEGKPAAPGKRGKKRCQELFRVNYSLNGSWHLFFPLRRHWLAARRRLGAFLADGRGG